jgi:hypothetical protein
MDLVPVWPEYRCARRGAMSEPIRQRGHNLPASFTLALMRAWLRIGAGRIVEQGPPQQIFDAPETHRTRDFLSHLGWKG